MTVPAIGRAGQPVYSPVGATLSITNGLHAASFTGTAFVATNPTTNAAEYAVTVGDVLVVSGVAFTFIENIVDATHLTLCAPWSGATQSSVSSTGSPGWYIIRNTVSPFSSVAKAIADVYALGSDTSPDASRTIDDGTTARLKLRLKSSAAMISVGPTGAADASLVDSISFDPTTGLPTFLKGAATNLASGALPANFGSNKTTFQAAGGDNLDTFLLHDAFGLNAGGHNSTPHLVTRVARGTRAAPTAIGTTVDFTPTYVSLGDFLGAWLGIGHDGAAYDGVGRAGIGLRPTEQWAPGAHGAGVSLAVTLNGTLTTSWRYSFWDRFVINRNIGTASVPEAPIVPTGASIQTIAPDGGADVWESDLYGGTGVWAARLAGGTRAAKTAVGAGANILTIGAQAWDGSAYNTGSAVAFGTENAQTGTDHSGYIGFNAVKKGSTTYGEIARIDGTGLGIGTTAPAYQLDVRNATTSMQAHFSASGNDDGGYLMGALSNGMWITGGAWWNNSSWSAKATTASILEQVGGALSFYSNSGLTVGSTFGATKIFGADSTGFYPGADNTYLCGKSGARWSAVWAATGTIQTSDARLKEVLGRFDASDAVGILEAVDPVKYRWNVGGNEDGKPRPGKRVHAGFLAQEVKTAIDSNGGDFAVWGMESVDDPDSTQFLRPDQLIPVLWQALRETRRELAELKAALGNRLASQRGEAPDNA